MLGQRQGEEQVRDHGDKGKGPDSEHPERWFGLHAIDVPLLSGCSTAVDSCGGLECHPGSRKRAATDKYFF
jgi:hypothetical protein